MQLSCTNITLMFYMLHCTIIYFVSITPGCFHIYSCTYIMYYHSNAFMYVVLVLVVYWVSLMSSVLFAFVNKIVCGSIYGMWRVRVYSGTELNREL